MDGSVQSEYQRWETGLPTELSESIRICLQRASHWRVPPNWNAGDWLAEAKSIASCAAVEAKVNFDPVYKVSLASFVRSRVLSRLLTRYRQEWAYALHFPQAQGFPAENGNGGERSVAATIEPSADANDQFLADTLSLLPERSRWLLRELFFSGRTEADLGRQLGISQRAVSKRKCQILRLLRTQLPG